MYMYIANMISMQELLQKLHVSQNFLNSKHCMGVFKAYLRLMTLGSLGNGNHNTALKGFVTQ